MACFITRAAPSSTSTTPTRADFQTTCSRRVTSTDFGMSSYSGFEGKATLHDSWCHGAHQLGAAGCRTHQYEVNPCPLAGHFARSDLDHDWHGYGIRHAAEARRLSTPEWA